jgi:hypothetical protein
MPAHVKIGKTNIQLNQGLELNNDDNSTIFRIFEEFLKKRNDMITLKN